MNLNGTKKILVIKLRHIGDVLLSVPVFRALRETFRDAHITALVNSGTDDVLIGNPLIDEVLSIDRGIKRLPPIKRYLKEIDFLRSIRREGFDMTVDLTGGDRAAIISFVSGARYRIGMKSEKGFLGKKYLLTHIAGVDGRRHTVMQNLEVVSQFGISTENLSIDFYIPEEDRTFIKRIIEKNNTKEDDIVVHVHPTSRWLFKCWKDEYMAEIIKWLLDSGATVIVTSSPDRREVKKAKRILSLVSSQFSVLSSQLIDLCGKTTIKQLGAISAASDLFFGVDSAPMHIAAAVGTPVTALFGPSGAFHWGPWDNNQKTAHSPPQAEQNTEKIPYKKRNGVQIFGIHTVIQKDWECIPCGKDGCNGSKISECLEDIKPEEVKNILSEKLKGIKK